MFGPYILQRMCLCSAAKVRDRGTWHREWIWRNCVKSRFSAAGDVWTCLMFVFQTGQILAGKDVVLPRFDGYSWRVCRYNYSSFQMVSALVFLVMFVGLLPTYQTKSETSKSRVIWELLVAWWDQSPHSVGLFTLCKSLKSKPDLSLLERS